MDGPHSRNLTSGRIEPMDNRQNYPGGESSPDQSTIWGAFFQRTGRFLSLSGRRLAVIYGAFFIPVFGLILSGADPDILKFVQRPENSTANLAAEWISEFGEFQYSSLAIAAIFLCLAWSRRSGRLRTIGLALLISGILGGVSVNVFRPAFGRARPHQMEDGRFTWFRMNSRYQGFPSGHTTSTTASMTALAVLYPPAAAPAIAVSVAVGWSRMQRNKHYLSDVIGGWLLGSFCGLWGIAILRPKSPSQSDSSMPASVPGS